MSGAYRLSRVIVVNIVLVTILLALTLLGFELVLRAVIPSMDFRGLSQRTDDPIAMKMKPNADMRLGGVRVVTNSDGYRDREFAAPHIHEKLIGVLGDSVTFGQGVPQDLTYPALMEKNLNALLAPQRFRVWNLGVCGYNTEQEYYVFKSFLLPKRPVWVVMGYNLHNSQPIDRREAPDESGTSWLTRLLDPSESRTLAVLKTRVGALIRRLRPDWYASSFVTNINDTYTDPKGYWERRKRFILDTHTQSKAAGAGFTLAILPIMVNFDQYPFLQPHHIIIDFCKANGIDYIDLLPFFKGKDYTRLHVSLIDSHANKDAQAVFAEAIVGHLKDKLSQTPIGVQGIRIGSALSENGLPQSRQGMSQ